MSAGSGVGEVTGVTRSARYDLKPEQREGVINQQVEQLRAERLVNQMNVIRWEAIPEVLQDGTEEAGIETAKHAIGVLEAQIDALVALLPKPNRATRRAKGTAK